MSGVLDPFRFVLIAVAGWMNQRQLQVIDYLREVYCVLREQLGGRGELVVLAGQLHGRLQAGPGLVDLRRAEVAHVSRVGGQTIIVDFVKTNFIAGKITRTIDFNAQTIMMFWIVRLVRLDVQNFDITNATPAFDPHIREKQRR